MSRRRFFLFRSDRLNSRQVAQFAFWASILISFSAGVALGLLALGSMVSSLLSRIASYVGFVGDIVVGCLFGVVGFLLFAILSDLVVGILTSYWRIGMVDRLRIRAGYATAARFAFEMSLAIPAIFGMLLGIMCASVVYHFVMVIVAISVFVIELLIVIWLGNRKKASERE